MGRLSTTECTYLPTWQPMMLSQLRCGTKLDHLKLLNTIRHVHQATRHDLPLRVHIKIHDELLTCLYG